MASWREGEGTRNDAPGQDGGKVGRGDAGGARSKSSAGVGFFTLAAAIVWAAPF